MVKPPYNHVEDIASGGFGRVAKVQDQNGHFFALKYFHPNFPMTQIELEDVKRRFIREAKYQQTLTHPNIVAIYDTNIENNPPYYVMELAVCSLDDELKNDHTLGGNPHPALFDILNGLEVIETHGFSHRDLKPKNILKILNPDGSARYAISDFGLMNPGSTDTTTLTMTGAKGGSADYAAPELMQDFKTGKIQSDIYAFGAILHDIFVDRPRTPYTPLSGVGLIGQIIEKCTKRNPIRRYQNIATLREDLSSALTSIGQISFSSPEETKIINLLKSKIELTGDEWDEVFYTLNRYTERDFACFMIFQALRNEHLLYLNSDSPELLKALGSKFCDHALIRGFDFSYCDVLAARLIQIYNLADLELKAYTLLALLELGTSHNRWLVERHFYMLTQNNADSHLIRRFLVEADVRGYNLRGAIQHLLSSINININDLHPFIQNAVK